MGYLLQFGGFGNRASRLIRNGEMIAATVNRKATVTAERKYHVLAENRGGAIRLGVDGEEIFRLQDGSPLKGSLHSRVGFYTWGCTLRIEKLTVYTEQAK